MAQNPLTPAQHRAAELIGQGWLKKRAAAEVGVSPKAVQRWLKRDDFRILIANSRERVLKAYPTAQDTLEAALTATTREGAPDWRTRVSAARALIGADGPEPPEPDRAVTFNDQSLS